MYVAFDTFIRVAMAIWCHGVSVSAGCGGGDTGEPVVGAPVAKPFCLLYHMKKKSKHLNFEGGDFRLCKRA